MNEETGRYVFRIMALRSNDGSINLVLKSLQKISTNIPTKKWWSANQ
jgi:hypothetical protein